MLRATIFAAVFLAGPAHAQDRAPDASFEVIGDVARPTIHMEFPRPHYLQTRMTAPSRSLLDQIRASLNEPPLWTPGP